MIRAALLSSALVLSLLPGCSSGTSSGGMKPAASSDSGGGGSDSGKGSPDTVKVTPEAQRVAGIQTGIVEPRMVTPTLTVPGQIMMDEERTAHIAPYADGKVVDVLRLPGDLVHRGEVLAHLHSHSIHETAGALMQDFANLAREQSAVLYAQQQRDRYNHLYAIQAASLEQQQNSEQNLVQAKTALADAAAAVTMEREHLGDLLQVPPSSITPANVYAHENLPITTPITGTVITRSITPGMVLEPGTEAYTVSDLGEVWMVAEVNQVDLADLRVGQHVNVRTDAWRATNFPGVITLIGSTLDPATRTVQVRVTLRNPHGELKPLMYATAVIDEADRTRHSALFVPESALQEINGVQSVFVTADGAHFSPHAVQALPAVNGEVQVTAGLKAGDQVAVGGAFMLKSDLLKNTLGSD
jgi:cobalt-zinc-cadmium efflux system membrane fusion protein